MSELTPHPFFMLVYSAKQVVRYPSVKCGVVFIRHDVNAVGFGSHDTILRSFGRLPRQLASGIQRTNAYEPMPNAAY